MKFLDAITGRVIQAFRYSVWVGNVGRVLDTDSLDEAKATADIYIQQSKTEMGRAGGKSVCIIDDTVGDIVLDYVGSLHRPGLRP